MIQILINGVDLATLLETKVKNGSFNLSLRADNRHKCSLTLITTAANYIPRTGQDLQVFIDTELVFGGIIKTIPKNRAGAWTGVDTIIFVDITSDGYHAIPSRRTVTASYIYKTAGYIIKDWIDLYLVDEGVSYTTAPSTESIADGVTLNYNRGAISIKDILDELADASGFKWWIDDDKVLWFQQESAITNAAHDIIENGVFTDFRDVVIEEKLENYRNKQFIVGGVFEAGGTLVYNKELSAEITARIAIEGGSGVYGKVHTDSNILTEADAEIAADNLLKKYGAVPISLTFNSDQTDWQAGTKLLVNLPTFGISTDTYFLIEEVAIKDLGAGNLRSYISATKRDSTDFSTQRSPDFKDYFADLIKLGKGGSGAAESILIFLVDKNASAIELDTSAQQVLTKQFTLTATRTIQIEIAVQLTCQASQMITCTVEVDSVLTRTYTEWLYVDGSIADSKQHIFDVSFPLEAAAPSTSKTVTVKMKTSTSTADIAIEGAYLAIAARGLEPPGINLSPEILVELEAFFASDISSVLAVASATAQTTSGSLDGFFADAPVTFFGMNYERYQSGDDAQLEVYGANWEGQTFTTQVAHTVDRVRIKAYRTGNPGTVTVEIYATSSDLPTGSALASGTFDGDTLDTDTAGAWQNVSLGAGTALSDATKYALVVRCGGDVNNKINLRNDASSPTYTRGARVSSSDSGSSWGEDTTRDYVFEEGN